LISENNGSYRSALARKDTEGEQRQQEFNRQIQIKEQAITNLQETNQAHQQRILALEADKQDLINQLSQAQEIYQNYLNQEKSLICQEIQLIKEVIHV